MFAKGDKVSGAASAPNGSSDADQSNRDPKTGGVPSIISRDLKVIGDLKGSGDIQVDGSVEGNIAGRSLTIGEGATFQGAIVAKTVHIYGSVNGEVKADTVVLAKSAKVTGDIVHESLTMEAGAFLQGQVHRLEAAKAGDGAKVSALRPSVSDTATRSSLPSDRTESDARVRPGRP